MKKILAMTLALCMIFALCLSSSAFAAENLTFTTGGETGTYYAFGSVIAQYVSSNSDLDVTAVTGNGSQANVEDVDAGFYQLAFCQSDVMSYAYAGTNLFEDIGAIDSFSVVGALYMEQVQIAISFHRIPLTVKRIAF